MKASPARNAVWEIPAEWWQRLKPMLMDLGSSESSPRPDGNEPQRPRRPAGAWIVTDPFYIVAPSPSADEHSRVLKHGETFAVFDHYGDVTPSGLGEEGLYHDGTRFLSCLLLRLGDDRPLFLSSTVKEDNALLAVDLTNADVYAGAQLVVPRGTVHIIRTKFLYEGVCYERIGIQNYGRVPAELSLSLEFHADYADVFEVRGTRRKERGQLLDPLLEADGVALGYRGLDRLVRRTRLTFSPQPVQLTGSSARFAVQLPPKGEAVIYLTATCETEVARPAFRTYQEAVQWAETGFDAMRRSSCDIYTSNEQFNDWLHRSLADLHMMTTETPVGPYPYAGVPWFSTPFGRDGLITALQTLWIQPRLSRGVLAYLADTQARDHHPQQDAEPGKILHETRRGEMANLKEIPFGRYYGSVDSTPLFVVLAGAYYECTGDRGFIEQIWPNLERALDWIDNSGDRDGDGFVEYYRQSRNGLVHQGWKDSTDSVFHADGRLASGPIALCEVQAYVYAAKHAGALLAELLGHQNLADRLRRQAGTLRQRFHEAFWCDQLSTFALALDGDKQACRVRTSNAGQCLFTGIATHEQAEKIARTLLQDDSFSGWGVRTVSAAEVCYNPMSYHNGSVWPHDNSLIAHGLGRYRLRSAVAKLLAGMFDASLFVDLHRLPELFCGFGRRHGEGPTLYPVACAPQAWATAAVFMLLQSSLGMAIDGRLGRLHFEEPFLPEFLQWVRINRLKVGPAEVDLLLCRRESKVQVEVLRGAGSFQLEVNQD